MDARLAFIGGINLHDDRDNAGPSDAARYDYAVQLEGGVVADIYHTMKTVWQRVQWFQGGGWDVPRLVAKTASAGNASGGNAYYASAGNYYASYGNASSGNAG